MIDIQILANTKKFGGKSWGSVGVWDKSLKLQKYHPLLHDKDSKLRLRIARDPYSDG